MRPRHIDLRLPVRKPQIWDSVVPHLQEILLILGGDVFSFEFYFNPNGGSSFPQKKSYHKKISVERTVLFSGGLDSAAAAAHFALTGIRAAYVTHYVTGIRRIESLLHDIYETYSTKKEILHAQFYIRPSGPIVKKMRENSRRSRSFFFTSLALATALNIEAHEVFVCENGPLAINLPLNPAMIPTRHGHSQFLKAMERFSEALFGIAIKVLNPYELMTKGEMTRIFISNPELALSTISCWNQQWSGQGTSYSKGHCGYCFPCLIRLSALCSAGILIPNNHFDCDVRRLAKRSKLKQEELNRLGQYKALSSFVSKVLSCRSWKEFLYKFPDVIDTEARYKPIPPEVWFKEVFVMMKRFAQEVSNTFGKG